jgi:hypothetical protein
MDKVQKYNSFIGSLFLDTPEIPKLLARGQVYEGI